jgi:hypothetical protein
MERFGKSRFALMLLRMVLIVVLVIDVSLLTMIFQHWYSGGFEGVKAWIVHMHASFGGQRWEKPVDRLVRESYKEFASAVAFLIAATAVLLLGERRVTRMSKPPDGSSAGTTR